VRGVRLLLRAEAAVAALVAAALLWRLGASWWPGLLALVAPDLSLAGKLLGVRRGAFVYNAAHTWLVPAAFGALWLAGGGHGAAAVALGWGLHIALDRALGFGLKDPDADGVSHLGSRRRG
jgi:hypothetical protein